MQALKRVHGIRHAMSHVRRLIPRVRAAGDVGLMPRSRGAPSTTVPARTEAPGAPAVGDALARGEADRGATVSRRAAPASIYVTRTRAEQGVAGHDAAGSPGKRAAPGGPLNEHGRQPNSDASLAPQHVARPSRNRGGPDAGTRTLRLRETEDMAQLSWKIRSWPCNLKRKLLHSPFAGENACPVF